MGLDQYIFRIKKAELSERLYTSEELSTMDLNKIPAEDFDNDMYKQLKPYAVKRDVLCKFYDVKKMIEDYNLPNGSRIWSYCGDQITIGGYGINNQRVDQTITRDEIDRKYTKTEIIPHYIFSTEEVWYWRKNYDLAEWLSDNMKQPPENTGYYKLTKTLVKRINSKFKTEIPEESATKESALFYWEWY